MKTFSKVLLLALSASLAACSTPPQKDVDQALDGSDGDTAPGLDGFRLKNEDLNSPQIQGVEVISADGQSMGSVDPLDGMDNVDLLDPNLPTYELENALYEPVIYFGFDQYDLDPKSMETVNYYAEVLLANPERRAILRGHTDERGSPEYNLALGEKRAAAVKKAMIVLGIAPERLEAVSMGEEFPAALGSNEAAWAKNRRVEIELK
ncbi:OmpA family protein [Thiomicrorhabdus sp. 6S3-12]|uniref:OmpA family protein n=1 Tax=Thiomicrorhabdus sp. 6S3-12 TaxID=2819681 RepID=UPI001AADF57A|nr:OmpA family protein [Thiomicrorhabdus sp. 6S3-12]MBO1924308.1 OmpA family protein [Thiomicrorhabdus sp. 6S3-12]